jgi:hypothetical protein
MLRPNLSIRQAGGRTPRALCGDRIRRVTLSSGKRILFSGGLRRVLKGRHRRGCFARLTIRGTDDSYGGSPASALYKSGFGVAPGVTAFDPAGHQPEHIREAVEIDQDFRIGKLPGVEQGADASLGAPTSGAGDLEGG